MYWNGAELALPPDGVCTAGCFASPSRPSLAALSHASLSLVCAVDWDRGLLVQDAWSRLG